MDETNGDETQTTPEGMFVRADVFLDDEGNIQTAITIKDVAPVVLAGIVKVLDMQASMMLAQQFSMGVQQKQQGTGLAIARALPPKGRVRN